MNELINRRSFIQKTGLLAGAMTLSADAVARPSSTANNSAVMEGLVAFRISAEQWLTEERFGALLEFFKQHPGTADELAFFTSSTHPPLPLEVVKSRAERLAVLMTRVRREGMRAGINLLATMGHHEENLDGSLSAPWQRVVDPHGRESRGSFCPASDELRGYVAQVYIALAKAGPDFIWIDDDVRLAGHMPIHYTCFCAGCLRRFSQANGREFTRESLMAAFGSGSSEERLTWRRRWLEHNRSTIDRLFALIEQTVHAIVPQVSLGFMTGDRFYEGYGFTRWAHTLAGSPARPVRWRPGGGFYSDESLTGLAGKAHDIGRQVSQLPPEVKIIQSEIENFPYDLLRKSAQTTVLEAAAHMAAGTTGTAFNVLSQRPDPLEEYEPILRAIHQAKPFYRALREELGRTPLNGVWPAWNTDVFAANNPDGSWPEGASDAVGGLSRACVLGEIGIPLCYSPQNAAVTVLTGPSLLAFSKDNLRSLFAGGVLMDLSAWQTLDRLGLSSWTGVKPGPERARDAIEVLSQHPLNGRFAGWSRDCRQSFWHETAGTLEPVGSKVEILARLVDYANRDLGISMTAFTNDLGGRVVVMGYFPWSMMHHLAKSSQMKNVCAWLSGGRLPVVLESFSRMHLWVRESVPGRLACVVLNASLDPARSPALRLLKPFDKFRWTPLAGKTANLKSVLGASPDSWQLPLPEMKPWSIGLLVASN